MSIITSPTEMHSLLKIMLGKYDDCFLINVLFKQAVKKAKMVILNVSVLPVCAMWERFK